MTLSPSLQAALVFLWNSGKPMTFQEVANEFDQKHPTTAQEIRTTWIVLAREGYVERDRAERLKWVITQQGKEALRDIPVSDHGDNVNWLSYP